MTPKQRETLRALLAEETPPESSAERLADGVRRDAGNDPGHPETHGGAIPNTALARVVAADLKRAQLAAETDTSASEARLARRVAEREAEA